MNSLLRIRDLSVAVGGRVIVKSASLTLKENTVLFLLDPNGSGKSTLLKTIVGILA